jgi:hypothetical protein
MVLHHWSNVAGLTVTDPSKQGTGKAGRERNRFADPEYRPHTNFGDDSYREPAIQGQRYHYTAEVDVADYYDIVADPEQLWQTGLGSYTEAENRLYAKGYKGYRSGSEYAAFVPVTLN